jgi:hypothetical protein
MKMLKIKVSITFFLFAVLMANPLHMVAQRAEIGLRFMPTFNSFEITTPGEGRVKSEFSAGFGIGGVLGINPWKHVGIQGEVIYSTIAQKYKETDSERQINLKYLNIPLLLSLNTGKSNAINFNVVAGPQIGISMGSSISGVGNDSTMAVLSVKKGDLGVAYGAGLDFGVNPAKTIRVSLGFRGVFGVVDISDNNKSLTTDSYYLLDRSQIQTYAGYAGISMLF